MGPEFAEMAVNLGRNCWKVVSASFGQSWRRLAPGRPCLHGQRRDQPQLLLGRPLAACTARPFNTVAVYRASVAQSVPGSAAKIAIDH